MNRIGIVYHSATGTTAQLAQAVESGVIQVAGAVPHTFSIAGDDIQAGRYVNVAVLDALASMDGLIFGTPTYMGGVSAQFKAFADATGEIWAETMLSRISPSALLSQRRIGSDRPGSAAVPSAGARGSRYTRSDKDL